MINTQQFHPSYLKYFDRKFFNGADTFSMFKLPIISFLFDNNLSSYVGGATSQKPYLKNGTDLFLFFWHIPIFNLCSKGLCID